MAYQSVSATLRISSMQRLAIFGGTFNPIHWGHLLIAEAALTQFALDKIVWIPTYQPPYKPSHTLVAFHHRLAMVQQAIASHPQFQVSAIEQTHSIPSHAIDTYQSLCGLYPNTTWYWILGLDAFQTLPRWYHHQDLVSKCHWLIAPRLANESSSQPGSCDAQARSHPFPSPIFATKVCQQVAQVLAENALPLDWHLLDMPLVEISSSLIRQYCHTERSIRYLVPDAVRDYILRWRLYQTNETYPKK